MTAGHERPVAGLPVCRARGPLQRLRGLAWRRHAPPHALLIDRCRSVHTFGMAYRLDLFWLDGEGRTLRVDRGVGPCRVKACRRARAVLEVPSGLPRRPQASGYTAAR